MYSKCGYKSTQTHLEITILVTLSLAHMHPNLNSLLSLVSRACSMRCDVISCTPAENGRSLQKLCESHLIRLAFTTINLLNPYEKSFINRYGLKLVGIPWWVDAAVEKMSIALISYWCHYPASIDGILFSASSFRADVREKDPFPFKSDQANSSLPSSLPQYRHFLYCIIPPSQRWSCCHQNSFDRLSTIFTLKRIAARSTRYRWHRKSSVPKENVSFTAI